MNRDAMPVKGTEADNLEQSIFCFSTHYFFIFNNKKISNYYKNLIETFIFIYELCIIIINNNSYFQMIVILIVVNYY